MKEILATSDPAEIAFLKSAFAEAGIDIFVFDEHLNAVLGGFGGGFSPCRIMVTDEEFEDARTLLKECLDGIKDGG